MNKNLVSAQWLHNNLNDPTIIILDASQLSQLSGVHSIFKSRVFDLKNNFSDTSSDFPNTFPTPEQFEKESQRLGINGNSKIIVYDNRGIYFSARVWWMFKVMGHKDIAVLDGGLPAWETSGYPMIERSITPLPIGNFKAKMDKNVVKDYDFIRSNIDSCESTLIDARSSGRFNGTAPEPREGLRSGHIPNSINIPYESLLNNGFFKSKKELFDVFQSANVPSNKPLTFSCGSGVTACIVLLAAELLELSNKKMVYDGSWTEWAQLTAN